MPAVEKDKSLRDQDLGTRTTDLEDWMLANFCVIVGLATIDFVVRYWVEVIELTFSSFFYDLHNGWSLVTIPVAQANITLLPGSRRA